MEGQYKNLFPYARGRHGIIQIFAFHNPIIQVPGIVAAEKFALPAVSRFFLFFWVRAWIFNVVRGRCALVFSCFSRSFTIQISKCILPSRSLIVQIDVDISRNPLPHSGSFGMTHKYPRGIRGSSSCRYKRSHQRRIGEDIIFRDQYPFLPFPDLQGITSFFRSHSRSSNSNQSKRQTTRNSEDT